MNMWTPPSGTTPQDYPARPNDGVQALVQRTRDLGLEMRDRFNNLLKSAGIRVGPAGMTIDSSLTVTGDLAVPNGAIRNDYLESPIGVDTFTATASAFAVPHAATNLTTATLTVPADRTTAVIVAQAVAILAVRDAGADSLYFRIRVGAENGPATFRVYAAYDQFGESVGHSTTVTGLTPGGTLAVSARTATGANAWPTWAANTATVSGVVLWLR